VGDGREARKGPFSLFYYFEIEQVEQVEHGSENKHLPCSTSSSQVEQSRTWQGLSVPLAQHWEPTDSEAILGRRLGSETGDNTNTRLGINSLLDRHRITPATLCRRPSCGTAPRIHRCALGLRPPPPKNRRATWARASLPRAGEAALPMTHRPGRTMPARPDRASRVAPPILEPATQCVNYRVGSRPPCTSIAAWRGLLTLSKPSGSRPHRANCDGRTILSRNNPTRPVRQHENPRRNKFFPRSAGAAAPIPSQTRGRRRARRIPAQPLHCLIWATAPIPPRRVAGPGAIPPGGAGPLAMRKSLQRSRKSD
jgi:hypothetical protein